MNRALFLDRDGVLNELVYYPSSGEWESPRSVADLKMIPGIASPLRRLVEAGWLLVIVTNQPSWAKGKTSKESLADVQSGVEAALAAEGVGITKSYVCFHHPDATLPEMRIVCGCRKPGIASLEAAEEELAIDLSLSWMVGDQDSDLLCGRTAGSRVALIDHSGSAAKRGTIEPDLRCTDLSELADALLR